MSKGYRVSLRDLALAQQQAKQLKPVSSTLILKIIEDLLDLHEEIESQAAGGDKP